MKVSELWLREWVSPPLDTSALVSQLTMAGLEVDSVTSVSGRFHSVVVAEVVEVRPHPDADKLRVCMVACGSEGLLQVVCGAANVRPGLRVPLAKVGAVLPGEKVIRESKLRGVFSSGMLCGPGELGIDAGGEGLMELPVDAPIGVDLRHYLNLEDSVIEVDLTPNRGDCLSIAGLARELGALNRMDVKGVGILPVEASIPDIFPVVIEAASDCPRYCGCVIRGVDLSRHTPSWMAERLCRSGIRSVNPVVDVTNYVMVELGQPMHAFDLARLAGRIVVRHSKKGEQLTLLDGQETELQSGTLVIADETDVLAIAGIMGGLASGVTAETCDVFLESAFFSPSSLAGKARSYGLHTDSSHRFERGVDYALQKRAMERAVSLLLEITGGKAGPIQEQVAVDLDLSKQVRLSRQRLDQTLGIAIFDSEVSEILERLGMKVSAAEDHWQCEIPSYRFDISIEMDLVEEVARVYGYERLPVRQLRVPVSFHTRKESETSLGRIRSLLMDLGYQEVITYSFIDPALHAQFFSQDGVFLKNPISAEMSVMRTSLIPGLVSTLQHNLNRQQGRVRLFESGLRFVQSGEQILQEKSLCGLIYGPVENEGWANQDRAVDFFDLKGDVERILSVCGKEDFSFHRASCLALHPGQSVVIRESGVEIGVAGALHPEVRKKLGIAGPAFVFELSLGRVISGKVPSFKALSRFPHVRRDIAVVVDQQRDAEEIVTLVRVSAGAFFRDCLLFDVYDGKGIEVGKKSLALGVVFQHPERSLNDDEVQLAVDKIIGVLQEKAGASLRN